MPRAELIKQKYPVGNGAYWSRVYNWIEIWGNMFKKVDCTWPFDYKINLLNYNFELVLILYNCKTSNFIQLLKYFSYFLKSIAWRKGDF